MADLNRHFTVFRTFTFLTVLLLSIPSLAVSTFIHHARNGAHAVLGVVASAISIVVLSILYLLSLKTETAIFAPIANELILLSVTWVLWLINGVVIEGSWWGAKLYPHFAALGAMSLISFSILMIYTIVLATLSVSAYYRGAHDVWRSPVKVFDWNEGSSANGALQI